MNHPTSLLLARCGAIALSLTTALTLALPAQANFLNNLRRIFTGDTGGTATGNTRGGAIRDEFCRPATLGESPESGDIAAAPTLIVLAPETPQQTTVATPGFFLYFPWGETASTLPASRPTASATPLALPKSLDLEDFDDSDLVPEQLVQQTQLLLVFTLEQPQVDGTNTVVQETYLSLPAQAGLVQFQLPAATPLVSGQTYTWNFRVICRRTTPTSLNPAIPPEVTEVLEQEVFGTLQRLEPGAVPAVSLAASDASALHEVYLEQGLWFEMVSALAQNPAADDWAALLNEFQVPPTDPVPQPLTPLTP